LYVVLAFLIGTTLSRTKEDYDMALLIVGSVNSLNTMVFYCAPFSKVHYILYYTLFYSICTKYYKTTIILY
jgi:hypothetical protein